MTHARPSPALVAIPEPEALACESGRISSSHAIRGGRKVLDLNGYIPAFLFLLNSALSRVATRWYHDNFGVSIVEWRTASSLAIEPQISARRVCELSGLDKAAASRSLHLMEDRGFATSAPGATDPRRRSWTLTEDGYALHDRIIEVALERERRLIGGINHEDLETFLRVMRVMRRNITTLER